MSRSRRRGRSRGRSPGRPEPERGVQDILETPDPAREGPTRRSRPKEEDLGWRSSRRTSKAGKGARKAARAAHKRQKASDAAFRVTDLTKKALVRAGMGLGALIAAALVLFLVAIAVNGFARWNARRTGGDPDGAVGSAPEENLLIIGAEEHAASGFLAVRVDEEGGKVFGIAIPDGAFMEVPGRGFERAGDSYDEGADVSLSAVSNFLSVPFEQYVVVTREAYQTAMQEQTLAGALDAASATNLSEEDLAGFAEVFLETPPDDVALYPLPVKPIALGDETYFEPQRDEVADLVMAWWGVSIGSDKDRVRVIVYNGSGVPGIAGVAARELITQGFRVVDTRNAEEFDHDTTLVYWYHGEEVDANRIRDVLGVGTVVRQEASQEIADVIVIIGTDYSPPEQDG